MQHPRSIWFGLVLAAVGLLNVWLCFVAYPMHERTALSRAKTLLERRVRVFQQQTDSVYRLMTDREVTIGEQRADALFNLPFTVLAYSGDSLIFWNSNDVLPSADVLQRDGYSIQTWK